MLGNQSDAIAAICDASAFVGGPCSFDRAGATRGHEERLPHRHSTAFSSPLVDFVDREAANFVLLPVCVILQPHLVGPGVETIEKFPFGGIELVEGSATSVPTSS